MHHSFNVFEPMSGDGIERSALAYIKRYQPEVLKGKPFDIIGFAEFELEDLVGVTVEYSNELPPEIYGLTDTAENKMVIQADLAEAPLQRRFLRSTVAHETGHCIQHVPLLRKIKKERVFKLRKQDAERIYLYRAEDIPAYLNPEWQAWRFAAAVLMPQQMVLNLYRQGADIHALADIFDVNPAFVKSRLKSLKLYEKIPKC